MLAKNATGFSGGKVLSTDEVAKHDKEDDCWVMIGEDVFNVTEFLDDHPGGKASIIPFAGKDATEAFDMLHQRSVLDKYAKEFYVGKVGPAPKL